MINKNKKAIVCGIDFFYYVDAYAFALEKLGYQVKIIKLHRNKSSAKDKAGFLVSKDNYKNEFCEKQVDAIIKAINEYKPDEFYSVSSNYYYEFVNRKVFAELKVNSVRSSYILLDSIKRFDNFNHNVDLYDRVFVFEKSDISYIKDKYGVSAQYLPIGAAEEIYCNDKQIENKKYDICFVGHSNRDRLPILEKVAKYCQQNNFKFIVVGIYWTNDHWWYLFTKRLKLRLEYPHLYRCVTNSVMINDEVSDLYLNSKVCLNIHVSNHNGINPRTFEIYGNNNFQVCDWREDLEAFEFKDGENIAVYKNIDECIEKIKYYLEHKEDREIIAERGCQLVRKNYLISNIIAKIVL